MNYISTRGNNQKMTSAQAIIAGLADDGGLFVPDELPQVDMEFIKWERVLRIIVEKEDF